VNYHQNIWQWRPHSQLKSQAITVVWLSAIRGKDEKIVVSSGVSEQMKIRRLPGGAPLVVKIQMDHCGLQVLLLTFAESIFCLENLASSRNTLITSQAFSQLDTDQLKNHQTKNDLTE
jgi:hypothetical protein